MNTAKNVTNVKQTPAKTGVDTKPQPINIVVPSQSGFRIAVDDQRVPFTIRHITR